MTIVTAFKGTLVHCPSLGQLDVLEDHILREDFMFYLTIFEIC